MRPDLNPAIEASAIDWVVRQRDPEFADWDDFALWLEESPDHVAAYDAIASLDVDLGALPSVASAPIIAQPTKRFAPTRRGLFGGALAAALIGVVSLSVFDGEGMATRVETLAGEHRTLTLADGSRIEVNGASIITLDEKRPRFAALESGEAMFHIVHREDDPFIVEAGDDRLVDLGTAFNVIRRDRSTAVSVSEGIVLFNPDRQNLRIDAGKGLVATGAGARPVVRDIDIAGVGGWRSGQLVYAGAPLGDVVQDLNRTAGITVSASPQIAKMPFHGALIVGEDKGRVVDDLAALSGVRAAKTKAGWELIR